MSADKSPSPRADFKKQPVFVKASIADQAGYKPGFVRQWASTDPKNHCYVGKYLNPSPVGNPAIGYCTTVQPWTVVQREDAKPGRQRDDDTKGISTAQTHGDLILIETSEENHAIYREADRLRDEHQARKLGKGDNETITEGGRRVGSYSARISNDGSVNERELLKGG